MCLTEKNALPGKNNKHVVLCKLYQFLDLSLMFIF